MATIPPFIQSLAKVSNTTEMDWKLEIWQTEIRFVSVCTTRTLLTQNHETFLILLNEKCMFSSLTYCTNTFLGFICILKNKLVSRDEFCTSHSILIYSFYIVFLICRYPNLPKYCLQALSTIRTLKVDA